MSTVAAVLKFVEINHGISFALNSLRIKYEASEGEVPFSAIMEPHFNIYSGSMLIDSSTVYNLELIQNIQNPQSTDSLFGLLNNTLTQMGV